MGFSCGIVGLPKVGKTTLFNAMTASEARVHEYAPASSDPNIAMVPVPDPRLRDLAEGWSSKKVVPASVRFVDVAGLARGASEGTGLGNRFLAHIREVEALIHVVRCFENPEVVHAEETLDPLRDVETIDLELILADLEVVEKRCEKMVRLARSNDAEAKRTLAALETVKAVLDEGRPAKAAGLSEDEWRLMRGTSLLTVKPVLYVANVDEEDLGKEAGLASALEEHARAEGVECLRICGKVEAELAQLPERERAEFMEAYGLKESGLDQLIRSGYGLLNLMTFFTAGPKEAHAWTIRRETKAPRAAGKIHSDMERGFIRMEVYSYEEWVSHGKSEQTLKEKGLIRVEGKEYVVREGDVCVVRFNV